MEVAEFVSAAGIDSEPDFVWWVLYTLIQIDRIISALISRTKWVSLNYGVQILSTVQEVYDLDKVNVNTLYYYALNNGMKNLKVAFDI